MRPIAGREWLELDHKKLQASWDHAQALFSAGSWLSSGRGLAAKPHHQRPKKVAFRFTRLIPVGYFSRKIPDRARDFASRLDFGKHLPIVGRSAKKFGLERCPTSTPVRQIRRIEEGRISGSS